MRRCAAGVLTAFLRYRRVAGECLRETLEVKYRHAASRGKTFVGDGELLLRLQELGSEPIAVVSAHHAGKNFYVYVTPSTLKPVGAVIMYDALRGDVASG